MSGNLPGGVQNGTPLGKLDSLCGSCKTAYWRCLGQAKCILVMPERALARFWSAQTRFECPGMRSHTTSVDQNAISTCRKALSLDVCRAKRILTIKERALARRVSIHFHCNDSEDRLAHFCFCGNWMFWDAVATSHIRSRSTPVYPNARERSNHCACSA